MMRDERDVRRGRGRTAVSRLTRRLLGLALVPVAAAGCSLGRSSPPLQQYVLGGGTRVESSAPANPEGLVIGVRRLDIASYLAVPAIAVRQGSRILHSEFHRWGEDLDEGINRAVARYLAAAGPIRAVDIAPWPTRSRYDHLVQLHVARFEGVLPDGATIGGGEAHLLANWEIIRHEDGAVLARGVTDYRAPGWKTGDYAGLVTLLDEGLRTLASDLVTCMGRIGPAAAVAAGSNGPAHGTGGVVTCGP